MDWSPKSTKIPGTEGRLLFKRYLNEKVIVTDFYHEDDCQEREGDLFWLRKKDGSDWNTDPGVTLRHNNKECLFHHMWFTKIDDWDKETN